MLVGNVAPLSKEPVTNIEVHILCQKRDVWMLIWALYTFLYHSKLSPKIVIHDDGSFDSPSETALTKIFPHIEILSKEKADIRIAARNDIPSSIKEYRNIKNKLSLKLVDIFLLSEAEYVLVLDSDILFYDPPNEIIDFVSQKNAHDAVISWSPLTYPLSSSESYNSRHDLIQKGILNMNSGIIAYKKKALTLESFLEYFENLSNPNDYFSEMTGWNALVAQSNFDFLPREKYIVKGDVQKGVVTKHFTSPRRFEMFAYGIDLARSYLRH